MGPTILAVESSCDETAASIVNNSKVLNNIIASQSVHEKYGGVVPELASRAHQQNIIPVVDQALKEARVEKASLDAIAFTRGPGLLGALLVGASFAKALAFGLGIPLIAVHHMQAHILSHFIDDPKPQFPFLCLTVSGGHTQIVRVNGYLKMEMLGETQDDAVGEAFDKSAKLMGLPYPGGPMIDQYAQKGDPLAYSFPTTDVPGLNFSFSGIKTAFLYFLRDQAKKDPDFVQKNKFDLAASIQHNLVQRLLHKLEAASDRYGIEEIAVAGGVSANKGLRHQLELLAARKGWKVYIPDFAYCTDNAAMIAMTAHFKYLEGEFSDYDVTPDPRLRFGGRVNG